MFNYYLLIVLCGIHTYDKLVFFVMTSIFVAAILPCLFIKLNFSEI